MDWFLVLVVYLKVVVAAVGPELRSAAAAVSAAFPVVGTWVAGAAAAACSGPGLVPVLEEAPSTPAAVAAVELAVEEEPAVAEPAAAAAADAVAAAAELGLVVVVVVVELGPPAAAAVGV